MAAKKAKAVPSKAKPTKTVAKPTTKAATKAVPSKAKSTKPVAKATTKASSKSSVKSPVAQATTKVPAKTSAKPPVAKATTKVPAQKSDKPPVSKATKKRKVDEEESGVDGSKKQKTTHGSDDAPNDQGSVIQQALHGKTAPKKVKKKVVINHPPTKRMNIYMFGANTGGELGLGPNATNASVKRPRLNPNLPIDSVGVVQVATGGMHCAALTHDNKILTWGVNDDGALGRDTKWEGGMVNVEDADREVDETPLNPKESTPTAIDASEFPEGTVFTQLAASDSATFALTDEGLVYGWGAFRVS